MAQQTRTTTRPAQQPQPATSQGQVAVIAPPRLAMPAETVLQQYAIDQQAWRTLVETTFPAAKTPAAVIMALDYCKHRKLDILKKPVHIVPVWSSQANNGQGAMVETIWPGINELRTTAIRTGQYAGMDVPTFGPMVTTTFKGKIKERGKGGNQWKEIEAVVTYPEWCQITVYRTLGQSRVPFPGPRVLWRETYATINNFCEVPNTMWQDRPNGQLEKCAEAAALRRAFPEEIGSDYSIDEIGSFREYQPVDVSDDATATTAPAAEPQRTDPKYQTSAGASPHSDQPKGQPEDKSGGAPTDTSGQPAPKTKAKTKPKVTDVEDQNERPKKIEPLVFEKYTRSGDFFTFADPWVTDPVRTEAELVAFSSFYQETILKGLASSNQAVANAFRDTKGMLDKALTAAQARAKKAQIEAAEPPQTEEPPPADDTPPEREPGEEG